MQSAEISAILQPDVADISATSNEFITGREVMLQDSFAAVYMKFKLHFYQKVFERIMDREMTLTTVETFCMEIIFALNEPTVAEFAKVANISSPNAAYKVNNLVKKGYLIKRQSEDDKREYHLVPTEKYMDYYNISYNYMNTVLKRVEERFTKEQVAELIEILDTTADELMPEIEIKKKIRG